MSYFNSISDKQHSIEVTLLEDKTLSVTSYLNGLEVIKTDYGCKTVIISTNEHGALQEITSFIIDTTEDFENLRELVGRLFLPQKMKENFLSNAWNSLDQNI